MSDGVELLDKSYDESGEITQFLILDEHGQPETKLATPENLLLYDPEDELPFDGGLNAFLSGDTALRVSDDPRIVVNMSGDQYSYILSVESSVVETTKDQASELLSGVYEAVAEDDISKLKNLHLNILENQVRRDLINKLVRTFEDSERISVVRNGWLIDDFYLVDWNANLYAANDNTDEGDYIRSNNDVVKKDTTYELVQLRGSVGDVGSEYELSQREMLFLSKVKWLLNRRHYHPDKPFWDYVDRWATIEEEEPNLDLFEI